MGTQDQHADGDEDRNPFEGIRPLSAPHDPEVPDDLVQREQGPEESQPGLDPTLPPIPPS